MVIQTDQQDFFEAVSDAKTYTVLGELFNKLWLFLLSKLVSFDSLHIA